MIVGSALAGCGGSGAKTPGIDMGATDTTWADKNGEQRISYMAARVQPLMKQIFVEHDKETYFDFDCETCHGPSMDLIDYKMPNALYALPEENTIAESMDYDEEITDFMLKKVMPAATKLFNDGEGPTTKVTCFTCHPKE